MKTQKQGRWRRMKDWPIHWLKRNWGHYHPILKTRTEDLIENTLKIKLDDNKLEIKKLIENERQQVEEIVAKNSEELSKKITKNQKDIKNLIWLVGGALAILIIFFKWF